jgi:hypothetical protein
MKMLHRGLLLAPVVLFLAGAALAQVDWLVPPPFEVQRDIYFDYEDPNQPMEPQYFGPDDEVLKESDFGTWEGLDFFDGKMGIDNREGQSPRRASYVFHYGNWDREAPVKLIWFQFRMFQGSGGYWNGDWRGPEGYQTDWEWVATEDHPDGSVTALAFRWITPNPPWEELYASIMVPGGDIKWVEYARIATVCVPEPGLIGLVGLGALGLLARRRK